MLSAGLAVLGSALAAPAGNSSLELFSVETRSLAEAAKSGKDLISKPYAADPSAAVFEGKVWLVASHDPPPPHHHQFPITNYVVFSMSSAHEKAKSHGVALDVKNVPWTKKYLWAPNMARGKNGEYHLIFPAEDHEGVFRLGVAHADSPAGPFKAEEHPIKNSFSIDPYIFMHDGEPLLYWGGLWGGQLERKLNGGKKKEHGKALCPMMAKLNARMTEFLTEPKEVCIHDEHGEPLQAEDTKRRYFEAVKVHEKDGVYYMVYSTGDTHLLVYATASTPHGPFTYRGKLLAPVEGWTTHGAPFEFEGESWMIFQDAGCSGGATQLRCLKAGRMSIEKHHMKLHSHGDEGEAGEKALQP